MERKELAKQNKDYVISLRIHFHQYPEASMQEFETSKKIKEELINQLYNMKLKKA